jgi:flagella basal body P-ring formation protein FlgA
MERFQPAARIHTHFAKSIAHVCIYRRPAFAVVGLTVRGGDSMRAIIITSLWVAAPFGVSATQALLPPPVEALQAAPQVATIAVPVLKESLPKGSTIMAEHLTEKAIPTSQAFVSTIMSTDELIGQQTLRPLQAGTAINRLHVRVAPAISRNQLVTLVYRRGGIELTGRAQALEDGQTGQSIRIINPTTRSTITGTVAADGSVIIN